MKRPFDNPEMFSIRKEVRDVWTPDETVSGASHVMFKVLHLRSASGQVILEVRHTPYFSGNSDFWDDN